MTDRERVMGLLEELAQDDWVLRFNDNDVKETAKAALALLKEQEEEIDKAFQSGVDAGAEAQWASEHI